MISRVRRELEEQGLLLVTDPVLPSVASIVAGEPVKGSWWSHPASHAIFAVVEHLDDDASILLVKLVSGKQTFVHHDLWRDFFSIATAKERWQTRGLPVRAQSLLHRLESEGELQPNKGAATELEKRLLAHGKNIHTESGAHAKVLRSWPVCMKDLHFRLRRKDPGASKKVFEELIDHWKAELGKKAVLPWQGK